METEFRLSEILRKLRKRIEKDKGHNFLYSTYGEVIKCLNSMDISNLTKEETEELEDTIELLIYESKNYTHYRLYSLRCYQCANELYSITEIIKYSKDIAYLEQIHYKNHFDIFVYTSEFKDYLKKLQKDQKFEIILVTICEIFYCTNLGRRSRDSWTEMGLHKLVKMGYNLFDWYLERTKDFESFPKVCKANYFEQLIGISESYARCNYSGEEVVVLNQSISSLVFICCGVRKTPALLLKIIVKSLCINYWSFMKMIVSSEY